MKVELTEREKMLLAFLVVMGLFCVYYFLFYVPMGKATENMEQENVEIEDQIAVAEAKVIHLKRMTKELEEILADGADSAQKLPVYDNGKNVMAELHLILGAAEEYSIDFAEVTADEETVRRDVQIRYSCLDYENAKFILRRIHDSQFRTMLKDLTVTRPEVGQGDDYNVTIKVTFYEHNETKPAGGNSEENKTEEGGTEAA